MKYFDRNTLKTSTNWQNKQYDNDGFRKNIKEINRTKKELKKLSNRIDDKIWWNSLSEKDQISAYQDYMIDDNDDSNPYYMWTNLPSTSITSFKEFSKEVHDLKILSLKENYIPLTAKRRELVINEIFK